MADILVVVEHQEGVFKKNTLSVVSAAKALSGLTGGAVDALVLGDGVAAVAEVAAGTGVRKVSWARGGVREIPRGDVRGGGGGGGESRGVRRGVRPGVDVREGLHAASVGASGRTPGERHRRAGEGRGTPLRVKRPMYAGTPSGRWSWSVLRSCSRVRQTAFDPAAMGGAKAPVEKTAVTAEACGTAFVSRQETKSSVRN